MIPVKRCTTCRFAVLAGFDALFCEAPQNAVAPSRAEMAVGRSPLDRDWRWPSCNTQRRPGLIAAWFLKRFDPPPGAWPVARRACCGVPEDEPCRPTCPAEVAAARAMDPEAPVDALREITRQEVARFDRQAFDRLYEADPLLNLLARNASPHATDPAS